MELQQLLNKALGKGFLFFFFRTAYIALVCKSRAKNFATEHFVFGNRTVWFNGDIISLIWSCLEKGYPMKG